MDRRDWLRFGAGVGTTLPLVGAAGLLQAAPQAPRGLGKLRITDVKTILTAPANIRLVVVKVMTSEPGLYGLVCATFTQRARTVETAVDKYLKPFLIGKNPLNVEDIYQSS